MKTLSVALAIAGLALATILVGWFGVGRVAAAAMSVGWAGLAALVAWQLALSALLGLAWSVIVPAATAHARAGLWGVMLWGRLVRDAASNCLPLSQVGGFVLGARAITLHGIAWPVAAASTIVDVSTEFAAELCFAATGLLILLARDPGSAMRWPLVGALGVAILAGGVCVWLQRGGAPVLARLGARIVGPALADAAGPASLAASLATIHARRARLAGSVVLHMLGWLGTGIAGWLAYRLLGAAVDLPAALAIEALLTIVLAAGFIVPGHAGIQEAAYAALGAIFGIPPDLSISVSLLRRARDVLIGVPVLLLWQAQEMRRLRLIRQSSPSA